MVDPLEDLIVEAVSVGTGPEPGARRLVRERRASSAAPPSAPDDVLRVLHLGKRFGGVVALRDINLHLRRGETLGLVGDNASGKSTLLKIIAGFHRPDAGQLVLRGAPVDLQSVEHARSLGIDCVYQDLALIDGLSAAENIFLGRERVHRGVPFLARRLMRALAREALDDLGVRVDSLDVSVGHLSGGQRQAIAVARCMRSAAQIVLLDEPIAAMGHKEAKAMLTVLSRLRERAPISMIFVAHNYGHVLNFCDRVNLIQDGCIALDKPTSNTSIEELDQRVRGPLRQGGGANPPGTPTPRAEFGTFGSGSPL